MLTLIAALSLAAEPVDLRLRHPEGRTLEHHDRLTVHSTSMGREISRVRDTSWIQRVHAGGVLGEDPLDLTWELTWLRERYDGIDVDSRSDADDPQVRVLDAVIGVPLRLRVDASGEPRAEDLQGWSEAVARRLRPEEAHLLEALFPRANLLQELLASEGDLPVLEAVGDRWTETTELPTEAGPVPLEVVWHLVAVEGDLAILTQTSTASGTPPGLVTHREEGTVLFDLALGHGLCSTYVTEQVERTEWGSEIRVVGRFRRTTRVHGPEGPREPPCYLLR